MHAQGEGSAGTAEPAVSPGDSEERELHRLAGISALALVVGYIVIIALFTIVGPYPRDGEAALQYFDGKTSAWWAIVGLSILTDLFYIPVALSLYKLLKGFGRNVVRAAAGLLGLFVVLDLAVTWTNIAALITLSDAYAVATSDVQRAAYVAAANYATGVLASSLFGVYTLLVPALGILLFGFAMTKGIFSRGAAYVGVVTGVFGVVSVAGPFFVADVGTIAAVLTSVLTTVWFLLVGVKLYRLGRP